MKYIKTLVMAVALLGVGTPLLAAVPTMEQAQDFIQNQPQTTDPRVENAQKAFSIALQNFMQGAMMGELNANETKIKAIFEAEDLGDSLAATDAALESIADDDPAAEEKVFKAYKENKYIKQLIPLFTANQDRFKDYDKTTFEKLVIEFTIVTVAMQETMKEQAGAQQQCSHADAPANAAFCPTCGAKLK